MFACLCALTLWIYVVIIILAKSPPGFFGISPTSYLIHFTNFSILGLLAVVILLEWDLFHKIFC